MDGWRAVDLDGNRRGFGDPVGRYSHHSAEEIIKSLCTSVK